MAATPIEIAGFACRFGRFPDAASFWPAVQTNTHAIDALPAGRWTPEEWFRTDADIARYRSIAGGYLPDIDIFDAAFFSIPLREAALMDPQQRILLETAWHAIEDAGIGRAELRRASVGVFVGAMSNDWSQVHLPDVAGLTAAAVTGNGHALLSNRLSYALDLCGPSLTIDTACSSALVALHQAVRAIEGGECELAIVGSANVIVTPLLQRFYEKAGLAAGDGRCKPFARGADGIGRGEGCGVVILRRQNPAQPGRITIAGSAVNHNGRSNGLTAPRREAQANVVRTALACAGLRPAQIDYVECHGTGTVLGDRIELRALQDVFGTDRDTPCRLGAVKGLLGHLEAASGMAGLIKALLMLRHDEMPAAPFSDDPNPALDHCEALQLADTSAPFPAARDAHVGISAFGLGGTNAHVILRRSVVAEAVISRVPVASGPHLFTIGGFSAAAVERQRQGLLRAAREEDFDVIAVSAALRRLRSVGRHRHGFVARDRAEALQYLTAQGRVPPVDETRLLLIFSGQGAQRPGMGAALRRLDAFRDATDRCADLFAARHGRSLLPVFETDRPELLRSATVAQPALFAFQIGLARVWLARGLRPSAVIGHSVGEFAAAVVSGHLDLETAMCIVMERGELIDRFAEPGGMLAVEADDSQIAPLLATVPRVTVAVRNDLRSLTLAGPNDALDRLAAMLRDEGFRFRRLDVTHGFHSPLLDSVLIPFAERIKSVATSRGHVPMISTVTGEWLTTPPDADYWVRQLREPVRFAEACGTAATEIEGGVRIARIALEIGPSAMLVPSAHRNLGDAWKVIGHGRPGGDEWTAFIQAEAALWKAGCETGAVSEEPSGPAGVGVLPPYPFEPTRFERPGRAIPLGAVFPPPFLAVAADAAIGAPKAATAPIMDAGTLDALIRDLIFEIMGIQPHAMRGEDRLAEDLGFDSLRTIELAGRLKEALGPDNMPPVAGLLEVVSLDALVARLHSAQRAPAVVPSLELLE